MKISIKQWITLLFLMVSRYGYGAMPGGVRIIKAKQSPIVTVQDAVKNVRMVIDNMGDKQSDISMMQKYEKDYSDLLLRCAKVLSDSARGQIMDALQEIDSRVNYWQYQKDHQWSYFVSKSPLKWVTGVPQDVEIEHNLEQLQSHQGELYVLLGQLSQHGNIFAQGYKNTFLTDHNLCYAWIDDLLRILSRITIDENGIKDKDPFTARALSLRLKLECVSDFKNIILADIAETAIPSHLARNWLKYGALTLAAGYGNAHIDELSAAISQYITQGQKYATDVAGSVKEIFFPGSVTRQGLVVQEGNLEQTRLAMINFLETLQQKKIISAEEMQIIIADEAKGSSAAFQALLNNKIYSTYWRSLMYGVQAATIFTQLVGFQAGSNTEKEIAGLRNTLFLMPAMAAGVAGYMAYKHVMAPNYAPMRRILFTINGLFVDTTKELDDEQYGKMSYLLYGLKKQAEKLVPQKDNVRAEFLQDLEKIESKEYNVAAKRRIVKDMFKKYLFLGAA